METKKLPTGITAEMIEAAKTKYGENALRYIDLPKDDMGSETLTVLARVPDRSVVSQYRRFSDSDPKKADDILVKNCILSHKEEVLADDGLVYGAVTGLAELIPIRQGIVKNL